MSKPKPQPFPLEQLGTCAEKQCLPFVAGTITDVFKYHSGTQQKSGKEYSIQDIKIRSDHSDKVVKVKIWDHNEVSRNDAGRRIEIFAKESDKGLSGIYITDEEYPAESGNWSRFLRLTSSAIVQIGSQAGQGARQEENEPPREEQRRQEEPPRREQPRREKAEADPIRDSKAELLKLANLQLLAMLAVEKYIAPQFKAISGREMPEDRRGAACSSLVIAGEKRGLHLQLPTRPLTEDEL